MIRQSNAGVKCLPDHWLKPKAISRKPSSPCILDSFSVWTIRISPKKILTDNLDLQVLDSENGFISSGGTEQREIGSVGRNSGPCRTLRAMTGWQMLSIIPISPYYWWAWALLGLGSSTSLSKFLKYLHLLRISPERTLHVRSFYLTHQTPRHRPTANHRRFILRPSTVKQTFNFSSVDSKAAFANDTDVRRKTLAINITLWHLVVRP